MFSPIQQARYIDVSISEFQKHAFESFLAPVSRDVSQNGNLEKRIIHLSRNITYMTYTTFIFVKVF